MSAKPKKIAFAMSRRRRAGIIILSLLFACVLISLDHNYNRNERQQPPTTDTQTKNYDFEKYHQKTFTVIKVVDGDTIDIDIPDGKKPTTRIRLWGVDTPETKNPKTDVMHFGPEAAEFTRQSTLGKQVTVYLEEHRTRGKFGRLLAYVQLPDGNFLNEVLLSDGFAYADLRFRHSFYNKYKQLEAAARSQKKGLWKEVMREQLPQWLQSKKTTLLKSKN